MTTAFDDFDDRKMKARQRKEKSSGWTNAAADAAAATKARVVFGQGRSRASAPRWAATRRASGSRRLRLHQLPQHLLLVQQHHGLDAVLQPPLQHLVQVVVDLGAVIWREQGAGARLAGRACADEEMHEAGRGNSWVWQHMRNPLRGGPKKGLLAANRPLSPRRLTTAQSPHLKPSGARLQPLDSAVMPPSPTPRCTPSPLMRVSL